MTFIPGEKFEYQNSNARMLKTLGILPLVSMYVFWISCFGFYLSNSFGIAILPVLQGGGGSVATLGRHLILEMWGCCNESIDNIETIKEILTKATAVIKATLVDIVCHRFSPYGITGVAILAESHISIHTWPEYGYIAADIFICGNTVNPQDAASYMAQAVCAKEVSLVELKRGDLLSKRIQDYKPIKITTSSFDPKSPAYL